MKKALIALSLVLFAASSAMASPFSPATLKLSAPSQVQYNFDGKTLSIPVTVTGTPSNTIFCVYTNGQASKISQVRNGYLGWHYVNKTDTSIYIAPAVQLSVGSNTIGWEGKNDDGSPVPPGTYTYYLWGYDNISPKISVSNKIIAPGGWGGKLAHIQETGPTGMVLANPVWYGEGCAEKWVIGNDPADSTLIETTDYALPEGFSAGLTLALQPGDHSKVFLRTGKGADKIQTVSKYSWVPNGRSVLETAWGENGMITWSGFDDGVVQPGPEIVGDFLWTGQNDYQQSNEARSSLIAIDWREGTKEREIDLTGWWSNLGDVQAGGLLNGGPNGVIARNGYLFLNCHCSCIKQLVNPAAETEDDFYVWSNLNGDYVLDHNFEENSTKKWVCNDLTVGPYTYHLGPDANLFSIAPCYDMGAVSFGLLAPDGDGIGYFAYGGETAAWKWFNIIVDSGSAFDGIYCDNQSSSKDQFVDYIRGLYYIAQDSFKGVISKEVGVADSAPAAFSVARNTPNPFNPATTIRFTLAKGGHTTVEVFNTAGQKVDTLVNATLSAGTHSVHWNASDFSAGVYFYTVKSGSLSKTMKMTFLK